MDALRPAAAAESARRADAVICRSSAATGFAIGDHPFGQDETGRDLFAAIMRGIQNTMVVIIVLAILSTTLGVVIGAVSGYFGGWWDAVLMRLTDIIIIIPVILITAVAGYALGASGVLTVAIVMGLFLWVGLARLVRAEFLALREREFVDAARVAGASSGRIIFKHILPNSVGVIVVNMTLLLGAGILTEVALSFLGFGIRPPDISLGSLISQYSGALTTRPWLFVWPGVFIIIIVLCIQFIGDGLRDAFDPRQKRIPKQKDLKEAEAGHPADGNVLMARRSRSRGQSAGQTRPAPSASRTAIAAMVPMCQRTGGLSNSSRGLSRWPASRSASQCRRIASAAWPLELFGVSPGRTLPDRRRTTSRQVFDVLLGDVCRVPCRPGAGAAQAPNEP